MGKISRPRRGSLQFWPRKRAKKILPSANWQAILKNNSDKKLLGFIGYKVGMLSAYVKDLTNDSMTKNKRISVPVTILECPPIKILSARFYRYGEVVSDVLAHNLDKELISKIKLPLKHNKKIEDIKDYDDVKVIVYSIVKKTGIKKVPDIAEIALGGNIESKIAFVKENLGKEMLVGEAFQNMQLIDIHGVTKGHGLEGAVNRFGLSLKQHKSEKGRRRPGSLGPWHPARVTFRAPMAGQKGLFSRLVYNSKIISISNINSKNINPSGGFTNFGVVKSDYIVLYGSVPGPQKRQLLITQPLRATRKQSKKNYELIELR